MTAQGYGLGRLWLRLRQGGLAWLWRRLAFEAATPTTAAGQRLHAGARRTLRAAFDLWRRPDPARAKTLYAFYDLRVSPVTFDFLWFLVGADLARRQAGADAIHIVIVPGDHEGVRQERTDYEKVIGPEARRFRIFNITIPAIALLPSVSGFTWAGARGEAAALRAEATHVYPAGYEPALPTFMHPSACLEAAREGAGIAVLRAPPAALEAVDRWLAPRLDGRRLITVTLRHYAYMPARNSRLDQWAAFARGLDPARYFVVFIPDTNQTLDLPAADLDGWDISREAAWNVQLRAALYERAYLNLGVNNGPMGLCWLNDRTRYVTFRMVTESVPQTTAAFNSALGFEPGRSLPFATPFQKWLWNEPDTAEVIRREFDAMVALIEAAPPTPSRHRSLDRAVAL